MTPARRYPRFYWLLIASCLIVGLSLGSGAQQAAVRKVVTRTAPVYPDLARTMALQGIVKIEALVAPDGSVKEVAIKGGHPVLAQAAVNTVRRWRWEPAERESREVVELKFSPD
jgi:TonB family protein